MLYNTQMNPDVFINKQAIATCRLPHPFMIIFHRSSRIGAGSTIFHGVTVGSSEREGKSDAAIIGDNVYLGCKSSIIGQINIVNGVKVGAHALVLKDVTEIGQTIVGVYK